MLDFIKWIWAPRIGTKVAEIAHSSLKIVKGASTPIPNEKHVVLLELWATTCPPCIHSIPHLTQLQRQYPEIRVIGVTRESDEDNVRRFVEQQGDRMDYTVAIDQGNAVTALVRDSAAIGIPHCAVIDKDGFLAWAGHPLSPGLQKGIEDALGNQSYYA
ncbi:thioredoxin-like protein [Chytriomyces sp. MP71]|nr:thioredoxin-like protein [Chytriomyces sp. MP71]